MAKRKQSSVLSDSDFRVQTTKVNYSPSAKNEEQKVVLRSFANNHITFVYGPPGTGKTLMATYYALNELLSGRYDRIVFTRPCIESFESLGYLPGTKEEKIAPYMIPITTYLEEKITPEFIDKLTKTRQIVTLPLAFMRGVTFKKSIMVLDEAQNTQVAQMRLFLTRMGEDSKAIITGDVTQSDIGKDNGMQDSIKRFKNIDGIGICELTRESIFRHGIIKKIEEAYEF
jgi:phosphate starvation-inducible PhoH-like protein